MNTYRGAPHAVLCFARCCTNSPVGVVGLVVGCVEVIIVLEVLVGGGVLGVVTVGHGQDGGGGVVHEVAGGVVVVVLGLLLSWHCCCGSQVLPVDTSIGSGTSDGGETPLPTFTSTL